jgi:hypothetical protein
MDALPDPAYWEDAKDETLEINQDEEANEQEDLEPDPEPASS